MLRKFGGLVDFVEEVAEEGDVVEVNTFEHFI